MFGRSYMPILAAALVLSACGGSGSEGSDSASKPDDVTGVETHLRPGLWESTVETKMAGMPPLPPSVSQRCISQGESEDTANAFLAQMPGRECSSQKLTAKAGKIDGELSCKQDGSDSTVAFAGSYTADSYDITTRITGQVAGAEQKMDLQSRDRGKRLGDCDPATASASSG